ncbi:hypothetical protein FSP39_014107 [Pinctada imbricata]|uniref:Methyltransferase FkbM domain-containing protein n=1 Tax=Pinctada imbricata TaxID=66713 RepID=A0AA88XJ30_PINIB|nr:hypothetical protein FSP39_014107 [Pinctada imbricata]
MIDKPLFQSLTFHSKAVGNFPIYVHDTKADSVSTEIRLSGTFEPGSFATIAQILGEDPEINVIDVGTNIGVLSVQFAKMGRKVISLEAAIQNIQHYCATLRKNKLQDKVTVIHNAVMDDHEPVKFILGKGGEFGVSFVDGPGYTENKLAVSKVKKFDLEHPVIIKSLTLDDLLTLPNINLFKKVFLKLDTEGLEDKVLLGAKKLFKELDVKGIFMEWRFHKTNADSRRRLLEFMEEHNFAPYNLRGKQRVLLEIAKLAPHDILWLPK